VFFQKNLADGTPDWVERRHLAHRAHTTVYPLVNDLATLTWLAQIGTLEIHVPQWRFGAAGAQGRPDRLVLDLDPGEGVGLAECAQVASWARALLLDMGLDALPVTSGSKGIHLYAALDGRHSSDQVSEVAHELARALEADHPAEVLSSMTRSLRTGKVFVDWSQNSANKTTIAPYSLRGQLRPLVAAPRTWRELGAPGLEQLDYRQVLKRLDRSGDPLAAVADAIDRYRGDRHSGEDRLVKNAFRDGYHTGVWSATSPQPLRPAFREVRDNPRSASAKFRWAVQATNG
jgi:bifunctional non-homologous end joining protein LigD